MSTHKRTFNLVSLRRQLEEGSLCCVHYNTTTTPIKQTHHNLFHIDSFCRPSSSPLSHQQAINFNFFLFFFFPPSHLLSLTTRVVVCDVAECKAEIKKSRESKKFFLPLLHGTPTPSNDDEKQKEEADSCR